jgi:hypothetical protein
MAVSDSSIVEHKSLSVYHILSTSSARSILSVRVQDNVLNSLICIATQLCTLN